MSLTAENISKRYFRRSGSANTFLALKPLSFSLEPGTFTALMGRSGAGKTTLLHILAGLLQPTEGRVLLEGQDLYAMKDAELSLLRSRQIGLIPQARSAIDTLTVRENILLPARFSGAPEPREAAEHWMEVLGIADLAEVFPRELSGGELRRMAIARAFAADPLVILADEPTGDLDDQNTELVLKALQEMKERGKIILAATHEDDVKPYADEVWRLESGA